MGGRGFVTYGDIIANRVTRGLPHFERHIAFQVVKDFILNVMEPGSWGPFYVKEAPDNKRLGPLKLYPRILWLPMELMLFIRFRLLDATHRF